MFEFDESTARSIRSSGSKVRYARGMELHLLYSLTLLASCTCVILLGGHNRVQDQAWRSRTGSEIGMLLAWWSCVGPEAHFCRVAHGLCATRTGRLEVCGYVQIC